MTAASRLAADSLSDIETARSRFLAEERQVPGVHSVSSNHQTGGMDVTAMVENPGNFHMAVDAGPKFGEPSITDWKCIAIQGDEVWRLHRSARQFERWPMTYVEVATDQVDVSALGEHRKPLS